MPLKEQPKLKESEEVDRVVKNRERKKGKIKRK